MMEHQSVLEWVQWVGLSAWSGWMMHRLWLRLNLSRAKAPGLAGHVRWSKRISKWIPARTFNIDQALSIDGASASVIATRKQAWLSLSDRLTHGHEKSVAWNQSMKSHLPDLQLINRYRVPYPFAELVKQLPMTSVWDKSQGNQVFDLDGNAYWDVTGSYGVNLLGTEFYKDSIRKAEQMASGLGPVLGSYHPLVQDNVAMLCALSGMDEVTFHMSGTEAVMQAVRLARYHTGAPKVVRFAGAYHGWWDDVQPGPGNPMQPSKDTLTLREMHPMTLKVLSQRKDIACVLVNPIQAMHPNKAAPGDSTLMANGRQSGFDPKAYGQWLQQLRQVCTQRGIALILDEVFLGFRMSHTGVQGRYGIRADMVTYGKTLGGGLPVGVVCGQSAWMKRFKEDRPADICFARGTFNAHPYVMASMNVFLKHWMTPECKAQVEGAESLWHARLERMNSTLMAHGMPIRFAGMQTIWTLLYELPSRYNWMFQYHLRQRGIALSWVGTGRFIFNFAYTESEFEQFMSCVLLAAQDMKEGGWWTLPEGATTAKVQKQLVKELLGSVLQRA